MSRLNIDGHGMSQPRLRTGQNRQSKPCAVEQKEKGSLFLFDLMPWSRNREVGMRRNVVKLLMGLFVAALLGMTGCGGSSSSDHLPPVSGGTETWKVVASPAFLPSDVYHIEISGGITGFTNSIDITKNSSKISLHGVSLNSSSLSPVYGFYYSSDTTNADIDILRFPITVGETWTAQDWDGGSSTIKVISGSETVTNLKGITATSCAHVRETSAHNSKLSTSNVWNTVIDKWICPGYGPFKYVTTWNAGQVSTTYFESFTPAGQVDPTDYWPMAVGTQWVMKN